MIPLRSTERVYSFAKVTAGLIAVNFVVFLYQVSLSTYQFNQFVDAFGLVPDQLRLYTLLTSMFLHGGWLHILGNMLFLWVFGRNVEDLIGGGRFLALYLLAGLAAGIVQVMFNPYSRLPTIGASGAIAGVMGAYLMKFPRARILTLVPIIIFYTTMEIPAALWLIFWFGIQFFSGIGSLAEAGHPIDNVAWFAHIGGFLAGFVLVRMFPERRRWRTWHWDE